METVTFSIDPRALLRQLIQQIYEQNINQYKDDENLEKLKYATFDFLFINNHLNDDFIDKICSTLTDDETLEIENTNEFRYNLWKSLINSKEYINYISDKPILKSGVFDKKYKREYKANYGEHWLSILSAVEDANITEDEYDDYININIYVYGENYNNLNILRDDTWPLQKDEKIKSLDKKQLVNDYQEKYWIKTTLD